MNRKLSLGRYTVYVFFSFYITSIIFSFLLFSVRINKILDLFAVFLLSFFSLFFTTFLFFIGLILLIFSKSIISNNKLYNFISFCILYLNGLFLLIGLKEDKDRINFSNSILNIFDNNIFYYLIFCLFATLFFIYFLNSIINNNIIIPFWLIFLPLFSILFVNISSYIFDFIANF